MMVVFLCGLVALILMRTLRNDYARFAADEDDMELVRTISFWINSVQHNSKPA